MMVPWDGVLRGNLRGTIVIRRRIVAVEKTNFCGLPHPTAPISYDIADPVTNPVYNI